MSAVSSIGRAGAAAAPTASPTTGLPTTTLLPQPESTPSIGDALNVLLQLSSQISDQQTKLGLTQAKAAAAQRDQAAAARKEAIARAIEAARKAAEEAEDSGGPFSFITDNIGVVGLVGLCTFQWGLVGSDVAAHRMELTDNNTNVLDLGAALTAGPLGYLAMEGAKKLAPDEIGGQRGVAAAILGGPMGLALERGLSKLSSTDFENKLDDITQVKDDDVRLANKIALMVALSAVAATSVVLSGGTSAPAVVALVGIGISTATQVAAETGALKEVFGEKAAVYVALGGAIGGAALTCGGSLWSVFSATQAATEAIKTTTTAKALVAAVNGAKSIVEGSATAMQGVRMLSAAEHQRDADYANADAEAQRHTMKRIEAVIDAIIDDLRDAKDAATRSAEILQGTMQTNNQTLLQAATIRG